MHEMIESLFIDHLGEKIAIYQDEPSHNSTCYTPSIGKDKHKTEKEILASIIDDLLGYYGKKYGNYPYYVPGHERR